MSFVSSLPCYEDRAFQIFCSPAWLFPQGTNMPPHFLDWFLRPSSLFLSRSLSNASKEMVLHFTQHVQVFCNLNIFPLVFHTVRNSNSFLFFLFDWRIVALQCVSFCRRAKRISHTCTYRSSLGIRLPFSPPWGTEQSSLCYSCLSLVVRFIHSSVHTC